MPKKNLQYLQAFEIKTNVKKVPIVSTRKLWFLAE